MGSKIWLIGAGGMAQDYVRVIKDLNVDFTIIGRGEESAKKCKEATGCEVIIGGIEKFLYSKPDICTHAIVAVGAEKLFCTTKQLLEYGISNVLVEKPGALNKWQFEELTDLSKKNNANVVIAYNRRFYASVLKAQEIIKQDGGVVSFNFEFTEWSHIIKPLKKGEGVKEKWFLGNSTHMVDLAFYLGGMPKDMCSFTSGSLDWHPTASNFCGAGICENGILFNYQANWESAGRWSVEMLTSEHRLILRPLEQLQIQKRGSIVQEFVETDNNLDKEYKPGLYLQTKKFLENLVSNMCIVKDQLKMYTIYSRMANY